MLNVGQILENKITGEIGFFGGINIGKPMPIILKDKIITFERNTEFVEEFDIIRDEKGKPVLGKFAELNNLSGIYFGVLNKKAIEELRRNWNDYTIL